VLCSLACGGGAMLSRGRGRESTMQFVYSPYFVLLVLLGLLAIDVGLWARHRDRDSRIALGSAAVMVTAWLAQSAMRDSPVFDVYPRAALLAVQVVAAAASTVNLVFAVRCVSRVRR
jgi:hypothetical protein